MRRRRALLVTLIAAGALAPAAGAATIPVTTTADVVAQDGQCSLREAFFAARFDAPIDGTLNQAGGCPAGAGADVVTLGAGTFELLPGAGGSEDGNLSGDLDTGPASAVRVIGQGPGATVIDPLLGDRAFDVFSGASLGLEGLTIRRGRAPTASDGGGVRNQGALTVIRSSFEGNQGGAGSQTDAASALGGSGGAIWSGNSATAVLVADSSFTGNAGGEGAVVATNTVVSSGGGGDGSAIAIEAGTAEISGTTFSGNHAGDGGPRGALTFDGDGGSGALAVTAPASATVVNSTFTGNSAGDRHWKRPAVDDAAAGAAILINPALGGSLRISWSTFSGNTRGAPAAFADAANSVANAQVSASVFADPAPACRNVTTIGVANIVPSGETSCGVSSVPGDARLGALADNGGPTRTLLPGAGSLAINALAGVPCPATDQRGLPRPALGACDAGAVEVQPGTPSAAGAVPGGGAGGGGAGAGAGVGVRRIAALALGPPAFHAAGRGALGTTVRFRLDAAGTVVLTVTRAAPGKRFGRRCVAPSRRLEKAKKCTRAVTLPGSLRKAATAGANTLRFSGKLRGRALAPGAYTLVLTLPKAGSAAPVRATKGFRIIR